MSRTDRGRKWEPSFYQSFVTPKRVRGANLAFCTCKMACARQANVATQAAERERVRARAPAPCRQAKSGPGIFRWKAELLVRTK